jgi:hypothetical protein
MLHHGPVRVPSDAQPGNAFIRVELPEGSKFTATATDIPVELVNEKPKE